MAVTALESNLNPVVLAKRTVGYDIKLACGLFIFTFPEQVQSVLEVQLRRQDAVRIILKIRIKQVRIPGGPFLRGAEHGISLGKRVLRLFEQRPGLAEHPVLKQGHRLMEYGLGLRFGTGRNRKRSSQRH